MISDIVMSLSVIDVSLLNSITLNRYRRNFLRHRYITIHISLTDNDMSLLDNATVPDVVILLRYRHITIR